MKKEEKQQIFDLLKTVDANINGYTREDFAKSINFSDDEIQKEINDEIQEKHTEELPVEFPAESTHKPLSSAVTISSINEKIMRCTRCGLARTRNNVVPGQGVENPDVMVIGEGPGYDEDMQGLPFVGKAGALLDKMLAAINLDRKTNCYIANIVKCRPPQNRDPFPDEQSACISFLEAQIHILKPKMILCMGRISGQKLLKTEAPLNQLRGVIHDYNGIPLMITYHPSALLRNAELKSPAWSDLKQFKKKLDEIKENV